MIWIIVAHLTVKGLDVSVIGNGYNVAFPSKDACGQWVEKAVDLKHRENDQGIAAGVWWECRQFTVRK